MTVTVIFNVNGTEIKTTAIMPNLNNEESRNVLTINNAVIKVKNDLKLDLWEIVEDVHEIATVVTT
jgi:hypothetical protein